MDKPHGCNAGRIIYGIVKQYDKALAEMQAFLYKQIRIHALYDINEENDCDS